ncbi:MAG TPA: GatB/YqeY domain-containing protein [Hyphomicrobiaceae bacterium]|nr:GatB/YqeY domain-containing protein [Hyphomicrobiaceae bacterium]
MREQLNQAVKIAMKAQDKKRLGTLRLIAAAIKDRDLGIGGAAPVSGKTPDADILSLLTKMVKQRRESIKTYEEAGRCELAQQEQSEIAIIEEFLPKQMSEAETQTAIERLVTELGAAGLKDMGRVMAAAKERFAGKMDFSKASGIVKKALG